MQLCAGGRACRACRRGARGYLLERHDQWQAAGRPVHSSRSLHPLRTGRPAVLKRNLLPGPGRPVGTTPVDTSPEVLRAAWTTPVPRGAPAPRPEGGVQELFPVSSLASVLKRRRRALSCKKHGRYPERNRSGPPPGASCKLPPQGCRPRGLAGSASLYVISCIRCLRPAPCSAAHCTPRLAVTPDLQASIAERMRA